MLGTGAVHRAMRSRSAAVEASFQVDAMALLMESAAELQTPNLMYLRSKAVEGVLPSCTV